MEQIGFKNFNLKVNDREIFAGIPNSVISVIDKLSKIGEEGVIALLKNQSYSEFQARDILKKVTESKPTKAVSALFEILDQYPISKDNYSFDPSLARGLDYYTGLIFELEIEGYSAGSVGGGGRYDKLIGSFTDQNLPAIGFSFGFDRIIEAMEISGLLKNNESGSSVLVTIFSSELLGESLKTATYLRSLGINTEIWLESESKLDKQIKYADTKKIPFVIVIGPKEVKNKVVALKNLSTGKQDLIALNQVQTLIDQNLPK
jgi:histidyl-tRNA synthetase